jgi:hypothetical protein
MSHYSVLVHLPDYEMHGNVQPYLDRAMAPFVEGVGPDSPYAKFEDHTEELVKEYETTTLERVVLKDGKNVSFYDRECRNPQHGNDKR